MKLPRLLNADGSERARLHPVKLSATINKTPLSVSNMVVLAENDIFVRDFVEIYRKDKSLGIFRVSSVGRESKGTQNVNLSHGIVTLEDSVTPAEITVQGTLSAVVATLLGYQKGTARWAVGSVPNEGAYKLELDRTNLLQAFCDLCKLAKDYAFRYDQTTTPWKINAYPVATENLSECRLNRNTADPRMTIDESDLCTRVVAPQLDNGYMDADTISTWGIVERDLGVADDSDAAEVKKYAAEVLEARKNPAISIEIDAFDLSDRTGDPIDRFEIGYRCRVAMADIGISVVESIESLYFYDLLTMPDVVTITLANKPRDVSKSLASLANQTSVLTSTVTKQGSGIRSNSSAIDDNKQFIIRDREIIDLHTKTIADQGLKLQEAEIKLADAVITLDAHQREITENGQNITAANIRIDGVEAEVELKANASVVNEQGRVLSEAVIRIDGLDSEIALKANQTTVDALGTRISSAEVRISGAEAKIELKVNRDGVISAINLTPESITIQASKINLSGYVTANQLEAELENIELSFSQKIYTNTLQATSVATSNFTFNGNNIVKGSKTYVTSVSFPRYQEKTIYYMNWNGNEAHMNVLTPTRLASGGTNKEDIYYLAY